MITEQIVARVLKNVLSEINVQGQCKLLSSNSCDCVKCQIGRLNLSQIAAAITDPPVNTEKIRSGVYQHYRTLEKYLVLGVGRHTETNEELVCYVPLYQHSAGGLPMQFRPVSMWLERVWHEKVEYPRFLYLGDRLDPK